MRKIRFRLLLALILGGTILIASVAGCTAPFNSKNDVCNNCTVSINETVMVVQTQTTTTTAKPHTVTAPVYPGLDKVQVIYFHQNDCPYCTQMDPIIIQIDNTYNVTYINLSSDPNGPALVTQYGITSVPTVIVLGPYHSPQSIVGVVEYNEITAVIGRVLVE